MPLNAFELVELRRLERGGVVGSDGRDWLRMAIGVALTVPVMLGVGYLTALVVPALIVAMLGIASTTLWTVHAGRKMVSNRLADLRSRS
jgi:hypothetical protein